ncbi:hypothetical protein A2U01_0111564, partial [Trifolium medium]|nr:hypothetical protein [Trifolium medium]
MGVRNALQYAIEINPVSIRTFE